MVFTVLGSREHLPRLRAGVGERLRAQNLFAGLQGGYGGLAIHIPGGVRQPYVVAPQFGAVVRLVGLATQSVGSSGFDGCLAATAQDAYSGYGIDDVEVAHALGMGTGVGPARELVAYEETYTYLAHLLAPNLILSLQA
jgi:hypothetical protein